MKVWRAFTKYKDSDGFYYLQRNWLCSSTKLIDWNYYPPDTFKILLYYPKTDTFAVSGIYERKYFNSNFTVDMEDIEVNPSGQTVYITAKEQPYGKIWEIGYCFFRIGLTLAVEIIIALLFKFRKGYMLITVAVTNIATQLLLNLMLTVIRTSNNMYLFFVILLGIAIEIAIFIIEAVIYTLIFRKVSKKEIPKWKTVVYALVANLVSFILGLIIL